MGHNFSFRILFLLSLNRFTMYERVFRFSTDSNWAFKRRNLLRKPHHLDDTRNLLYDENTGGVTTCGTLKSPLHHVGNGAKFLGLRVTGTLFRITYCRESVLENNFFSRLHYVSQCISHIYIYTPHTNKKRQHVVSNFLRNNNTVTTSIC